MHGVRGCIRIKVEAKRQGDKTQLVAEADFFLICLKELTLG